MGDGANISLWFDPWTSRLPASYSHSNIISNSGLGLNAKVKDIIINNAWSLPASNHYEVAQFRENFDYAMQFNSSTHDKLLWDNKFHRALKASHIWNSIRHINARMDWHKVVIWHKFHIPTFSFISWLVFHRKLHTCDVLLKFGIQVKSNMFVVSTIY